MERDFYLAFSNVPGIGPIKFQKLIKNFGSAKAAWNSSFDQIEEILKSALAKKFDAFRNN